MGWGCTSVNDPITLPRIGENTRGWRGTMLGEREQKAVAWSKADTYQLRINIHFKTSFLKQDKRLDFETGGVASILYQFLLVPFTSLSKAWSLLSWIRNFFLRGGGCWESSTIVLSLPYPLKKTSWLQDLLYAFPWKRTTWLQDWAHFSNSDWLSSP